MMQETQMINFVTQAETFYDKEAFSFRSDLGFHRLQRLALWVLRKIGAEALVHQRRLNVTRISFEPRRFMELLFKQHSTVTEHFGREPETMLIGSVDFQEMMDCPDVRSMFTFSGEWCYADASGHRRFMGLTVHVVPWMRGLVVLPKM